MKNLKDFLYHNVELTKLSLIKLLLLSMALGSVICLITSTGGVVLAIAGGLLIFGEVYNAITGEKEVITE